MTDDEYDACVGNCLRIGIFSTDACEIHCEDEAEQRAIEHRIDDVAEAAWERQIDMQMGLL